jgi:hypothetical protein
VPKWRGPARFAKFIAMESNAANMAQVPPPDRRQSKTALAIARGTARLLRSL